MHARTCTHSQPISKQWHSRASMMMFGIFVLVKISQFFLREAVVNRCYSLIGQKQIDIKVLWSELESNLLGEIYCRLASPTDQARFHAVCKAWLAVLPVSNTTSRAFLPWFGGFSLSIASMYNRLDFLLYEPSSRLHATSFHTVSMTNLGIPSPASCTDIMAARINDWLFICTRRRRSSCYCRNFVIFSPFTKKVIQLPQSDYPLPFTFRRTFSTDPNSPDCVFLLSDTKCPSSIAIMTYQNGDKEWTARQFERVDEFIPCSCFPIYFQGIFYIISPFGQMASYNNLDGEFRFENLAIDNHFAQNYNSDMRHEVFELNGDLMLIYFGSRKKRNNDNLPGKPCLKKFDWSSKVWIPASSLGGQSLFVGEKTWSVATVKARNHEVLPNNIYYFLGSGCIVYSLKDGDLVEHKFLNSDFTYQNTTSYYLANDDDSLGDGRNSTIHHRCNAFFWLEPPTVRSIWR